MKTVVEKFIEDFEKGSGKKFPEEFKKGWRQMAIEEIKQAWDDGNTDGWLCKSDDPEQYVKQKYPESFGYLREKE